LKDNKPWVFVFKLPFLISFSGYDMENDVNIV